ncbi:hypothetical protein [Mycolicibacterium phlei]|uniref:hypothetical protein n=1 Tax=Mycolicibacterium phlei TaxID=1771 RepID=UPI00025ADE29|nr:hypothetical protein [Mycolicibacterium phlei]EID14352.1 hypothetical protein MPHLEI_11459 [Mycolicibacterium phlei RIVM601174]MBF4195589.1 hypothetical protein [Mycolicibacterium phlei]
MTEQNVVASRLRAAGILPAIRWAYISAVTQTLTDYSEEAGYDAVWLGCTRHTLFRDRLDRVFSCGRYVVGDGEDPNVGLDMLHAYLSEQDIAEMPVVNPNLVRRSDLNRSPGWVFEDIRFLLASSPYGEILELPWPRKSPTKQQVASRPIHDQLPTLFDEFVPGEVNGFVAALEGDVLELETFVVAHSLDPVSGDVELVLGRPLFNGRGGDAWHWYVDLLDELPEVQDRKSEPLSPSTAGDIVPDAPVRLRQQEARNHQ